MLLAHFWQGTLTEFRQKTFPLIQQKLGYADVSKPLGPQTAKLKRLRENAVNVAADRSSRLVRWRNSHARTYQIRCSCSCPPASVPGLSRSRRGRSRCCRRRCSWCCCGGPVGAAVGAGVGGATGDAASGPDQKNVVIENRDVGTTGSTGCSTTTKQTTDATGTTTKQKTEC